MALLTDLVPVLWLLLILSAQLKPKLCLEGKSHPEETLHWLKHRKNYIVAKYIVYNIVYYSISKENLHKYNQELKCKRQSYFSEIININRHNPRMLFSEEDRLTRTIASVPPELLSNKSCNDFAAFFTNKILQIRPAVCNSSPIMATLVPSSN